MGNMFCSAPPPVSIPVIETIEETKEEPKEVIQETKEESVTVIEEVKEEPIKIIEEVITKEEPIAVKEEIKTEEVSVVLGSNSNNKIQEDVKKDTLENIPTNNDCSLSDASSTTSSVDNTIKEDETEPAKKKRGRKKKSH